MSLVPVLTGSFPVRLESDSTIAIVFEGELGVQPTEPRTRDAYGSVVELAQENWVWSKTVEGTTVTAEMWRFGSEQFETEIKVANGEPAGKAHYDISYGEVSK